MDNNYYINLIRNKPINYNGLILYPISFKEICDSVGINDFNNMLIPFLIDKDVLDLPDEEIENINFFEDIILKDKSLLNNLAITLQLFCKCNDIAKQNKDIILYFDNDKNFIINANNFNDISNIILKLSAKEKIKVEKPPKNMSERQKDVWYKLQEGRKKDNEKNAVYLYDMLNVCEFGGNYHIPIEEIENWSLWKIMNCYKARLNMKVYDDSLQISLVTFDNKDISGDNYWHKKLMVRE